MKKIIINIKKIFALYMIGSVVLFNSAVQPVIAQEATGAPEPTQTQPVVISAPQPEPTKTLLEQRNEDEEYQKRKAAAEAEWRAAHGENNENGTALLSPTPVPQQTTNNTGSTASGNVGDTAAQTGNATSNGQVATTGNTNAAATSGATDGASVMPMGGASVSNTGNGSAATNTSNSSAAVSNDTNQTNSAQVDNKLQQSATTGDSASSFNVGNSQLKTGDANVTGTAITAVNTNVDGVMVSEFNIIDDQVGDVILSPEAFAANCISGCAGTGSATNSANGVNSNTTATATHSADNSSFQNNDAAIGNELVLSANSGNNTSSFNTGGDSTITTGDANVSANSLTFVNNNIGGGNIIYGVVNIFGKLVGDIILPGFGSFNPNGNISASNTGNGAGSTNNAGVDTVANNNTFQNNAVNINNELILDANTGSNDANANTNGNSVVTSGSSNVDANVVNVANTNTSGGDVWLVIINEGGKWMGQILGLPAGTTMAGSEGMGLSVSPDGQITASNNGNGASSNNNTAVSSTSNNTTTQNNNAAINNTLNLSANTGNNQSSYNTGGTSYINTGDANIVANMVNFVNNNISGGNLIVTIVNVFGEWAGDFITPDQQKVAKADSQSNSQADAAVQEEKKGNPEAQQVMYLTATPAPTKQQSQQSGETKIISSNVKPTAANRAQTRGIFGGTEEIAKNNQQMVAGVQKTNVKGISKKVININLAWFLMLIPLGIGLFITRKIVAKRLMSKRI